jgi:hypothetical protein
LQNSNFLNAGRDFILEAKEEEEKLQWMIILSFAIKVCSCLNPNCRGMQRFATTAGQIKPILRGTVLKVCN